MKKNVFKTVLLAVIFAGTFILSSCQFAPKSTTVTITNKTGEELVYWLEYRLGSMQNLDYEAPSLADNESKTWTITGKLSRTAEKSSGLGVDVMRKSAYTTYKSAHQNKRDSDILMYNSEVPKIFTSFEAADSYNIVVTGFTSGSEIRLQ